MYKWEIRGKYQGETEVIDETTSKEDADYLVSEYRMAYGSGWTIWKKRVYDKSM